MSNSTTTAAASSTPLQTSGRLISGVGSGGVGDLKAALFQSESQLRRGVRAPRPARTKPLAADGLGAGSNRGISSRQARDAAGASSAVLTDEDHLLASSAAALQRKAAVYESLIARGVGEEGAEGAFLVDFERKGWQRQDQLDSQATSGSVREDAAADSFTPDFSSSVAEPAAFAAASSMHILGPNQQPSWQDQQRADWERDALAQIKSSEYAPAAVPTHLLQHSGAKLLNLDEKRALEDVIAESKSMRDRRALQARKRQAAVADRREAIEQKETRKRQFKEMHTGPTALEKVLSGVPSGISAASTSLMAPIAANSSPSASAPAPAPMPGITFQWRQAAGGVAAAGQL